MEPQNLFWAYWPYQLPNYALGVLMYTCLGRFLLGFFVAPDSKNYIWRAFRFLTDWLLQLVRIITPAFVVEFLMPIVAVFWLIVARVVFYMLMHQAGLTPPLQHLATGG